MLIVEEDYSQASFESEEGDNKMATLKKQEEITDDNVLFESRHSINPKPKNKEKEASHISKKSSPKIIDVFKKLEEQKAQKQKTSGINVPLGKVFFNYKVNFYLES